jgi:hypothetical protein
MAQVSATTREALSAGVKQWRDAALCNTVPIAGDVLAVLERTMATLQPNASQQLYMCDGWIVNTLTQSLSSGYSKANA